jgi:hypothetical protein
MGTAHQHTDNGGRTLPATRAELAAIRTAQQLADILHLSQIPIRSLRGHLTGDGAHLATCPEHRDTTLVLFLNDSDRLQLGPCCAPQPVTHLTTSLTDEGRSERTIFADAAARLITHGAHICDTADPDTSDAVIFPVSVAVTYSILHHELNGRLRWLEAILTRIIDTELAARTTLGPLTALVGASAGNRHWEVPLPDTTQLLRSRSIFRYPGHTVLIAVDDNNYDAVTASNHTLRLLLTGDTADHLDSAAHTLHTLLVDHPLDDNLLLTVAALHPGVTAHPEPAHPNT